MKSRSPPRGKFAGSALSVWFVEVESLGAESVRRAISSLTHPAYCQCPLLRKLTHAHSLAERLGSSATLIMGLAHSHSHARKRTTAPRPRYTPPPPTPQAAASGTMAPISRSEPYRTRTSPQFASHRQRPS